MRALHFDWWHFGVVVDWWGGYKVGWESWMLVMHECQICWFVLPHPQPTNQDPQFFSWWPSKLPIWNPLFAHVLASLFASDTFLNAGQTYSSLHFCPLCWQKSLTFFLLKKATRPFCVQQILFLTNALWFEELNNDAEGDKHIETCGCCGSGLEDEHRICKQAGRETNANLTTNDNSKKYLMRCALVMWCSD